jgi:flagellar assembly protein FliH
MTIDYKNRDQELQEKRMCMLPIPQLEEGFEEGLKAFVVDPIISEEEQRKKAGAIVDNANNEATGILDAAKKEARKLKEDTLERARKQGYEEGLEKGNLEIEQIKKDLLGQQKLQEEEYQKLLKGMEGHVSEVIISLITKLTGILVEDKTEIILYLVEKALREDDRAENYTLRVSREDFELLSTKKTYIEEIVGRDIQISVYGQLTKNQCLIETENKVINCSLDVQLNNLIRDLKLLSSV